MNRASPADLRKCLETANMLAHSGIRFVPVPAVTDAEFATLSAIFADKIESLAAEAEMEEISRIIKRYSPAIHFSNFDGENGIRSVCSPLIQESIISAHCCNM